MANGAFREALYMLYAGVLFYVQNVTWFHGACGKVISFFKELTKAQQHYVPSFYCELHPRQKKKNV
jgi:hypothetical protein